MLCMCCVSRATHVLCTIVLVWCGALREILARRRAPAEYVHGLHRAVEAPNQRVQLTRQRAALLRAGRPVGGALSCGRATKTRVSTSVINQTACNSKNPSTTSNNLRQPPTTSDNLRQSSLNANDKHRGRCQGQDLVVAKALFRINTAGLCFFLQISIVFLKVKCSDGHQSGGLQQPPQQHEHQGQGQGQGQGQDPVVPKGNRTGRTNRPQWCRKCRRTCGFPASSPISVSRRRRTCT